jgi:predicted RNA-binding protein with RPS1 domain
MDFGAFIELVAGRDGMAHVSELAPYRISKPSDFLQIGDIVTGRNITEKMMWVTLKKLCD